MIKRFNEFSKKYLIKESVSNGLLSLDELKEKYPEIKFTMNKDPKFEDAYLVRADIEIQNGETEYLGALRGPVSKETAIIFLNDIAKQNYDKYY